MTNHRDAEYGGLDWCTFFRYVLKFAARELAHNPELRAKAVDFVQKDVVPQAKAEWEKAKPKLERAKVAAVGAAKDVAQAAKENDPRSDPGEVPQRCWPAVAGSNG